MSANLVNPKWPGLIAYKPLPPAKDAAELIWDLPSDSTKPYDMLEMIERIVDRTTMAIVLEEFKEDYGKTIICGMRGLMAGQWAL